MKIEININKDVLRRSMWCGVGSGYEWKNCAVSIAIRDLMPLAEVFEHYIEPFRCCKIKIPVPSFVSEFIEQFDSLKDTPESRLLLPEFSFEIDVPDEVIERIGIEEAKAILERSETLNLIEG